VESNLLDVANIYYQLKDNKSAMEYAIKAQNLAVKNNDDRTLANAYNTLGVICHETGKSKEAVSYYSKAQKLKNKTGDILGQINTMINISMIYQENNEYNKALEILDTIVALSLQSGSQQSLANAYSNQGVVYTCLNQFEKANASFIKSYNIFSSIGALNYMVELAKKIGINYERLHDYKNAALFYSNLSAMKDSLFQLEMTKNLAEMKTSYETEKKEAENIRLTRENEIQFLKLQTEKKVRQNTVISIISGSVFIILLLLLLFVRFRLRKKAEMEKKETEQQKLRFKAVIEAEEKERIRIAKDLHDGLGQLLSTARINVAGLEGEVKKEDEVLLNNSLRLIDDAVKEVRSISHNMMPATLIEFGLIKAVQNLADRINQAGLMTINLFIGDVPEKFEQSTEIALYRIIQEVLNNMIKHSNARNILIELRKDNSRILLKIKDDGKGFDVKEINRSQGIGWKNIFSRLSIINGNIDIQSQPGAGTVINIDFAI
jgi:signal transduction histidine kinase